MNTSEMAMFARTCIASALRACLAVLVILIAGQPAMLRAGELSRADIEARFQAPLKVGDRLANVPAWPITSELAPDTGPVAYAFESIDLAPIPGFEGTPFNLLIAIDRKGTLRSVEVLRQHEPVFLSGLGEAPLHEFVRQYAGKSLLEPISVASIYGRDRNRGDGGRQVLDGVTKATASIRIVNQTVLTSALAVARAQLAFAAPSQRGPVARVRTDRYSQLDFGALLEGGYVRHLRLSNREVEALFAGTEGAGQDAQALTAPDDTGVDFYVAYLNAPTIGRNLLGDRRYAYLMEHLEPGQQAYWVATAGRASLLDDDFVRGTVPRRLSLTQDSIAYETRDLDLEPVPPPGAPPFNSMLAVQLPPLSGLDPAQNARFGLTLSRARGSILPVTTERTVHLDYAPPAALMTYPPAPPPDWLVAWMDRGVDLGIIAAALAVLTLVLARPRWIAVSATRLRIFRLTFLAFTLGFVGWYGQGQLSIVQLTGAIKSLAAGQGLSSFLYDPISLLLIAFTALSFFIWGRGTFCGWLCPFGALQEFVSLLGRRLGIRARRLPTGLANALDRGRYVILAALALCALWVPQAAERLVEVEPFKTAITVGFDRSWPFVTYAVALLLLSAIYYKFFCRFLCPLGAAITLGGKLRLPDWLARRSECGQPCQTCRHRCSYDAIKRDGRIDYDNCFQCLDCVGIYHDDQRCAPLILYRRKGRTVRR
ncbi:4Fe-4S binding protein [Azoarcus sp. L1K30]|uniref:4Fe-4S binding protein n=1 Tax=Azoarcus sp. L1K30 TaxID=2820277 RepID=UPI002013A72B|nr:4Fe-4S binding protein [Azoarcus sp. L1K30]